MGSPKKPKVGNRYYYTIHMVPCRKADAILAIKMADKVVWEGDQGDGYITIDDREAFGGDEREGGFSGRIAVMLGSAAQTANAYMGTLLGVYNPAFRGIVSLIFERPYFNANSARLPAIETKQVNITDIHKGWLPEKCVVDVVGIVSRSAIYIAMDVSRSTLGVRLATQVEGLAGFVRSLKGYTNSVKVVAFKDVIVDSIQRLDCTDGDYEDVAVWIEGFTVPASGFEYAAWDAAVAEAPAFYADDDLVERRFASRSALPTPGASLLIGGEVAQTKRRVIVFSNASNSDTIQSGSETAAAATIATIDAVSVFAFSIGEDLTSMLSVIDNTPDDGVPVITEDNPEDMRVALGGAFRSWVDLNPAHIQRCLLIDPMRGGTATEDQIGDSFAESADRYLAERFGISVIFSGAEANLKDRMEIDRHCDAVTYLSRRTGKWEHKLVRDDFDFDDLPVLDGTVVKDWSKLRRPKQREMPNKLTVIYTDRKNGKTASVTKSNPVAVRAAGRTIKGDDISYSFVSIPSLADRLCVRDLSASGTPLLAGDLPLAYLPAAFEMASVVRLSSPDPVIGEVAVRLTEIRHGAGTDASVWLKVVEHHFEIGATISMPDPVPVVIDDRARPALVRLVEESPYYVTMLEVGQATIDDQLAADPDLGRLLAAAAAPNGRHLDATVGVDAGGGWEDDGLITFSPASVTTTALRAEADQITVRVVLNATLTVVTIGQIAMIGSEIVRIDAMAEDAGEIIVTIGRGCLDTVPQVHAAGAALLFFGPGEVVDTDYLNGETIDVRLLPRTGSALLSLAAAPTDTVTFARRAVRPYPPGQFRINGAYTQGRFVPDVVLTWAHRDRTLQTTPVVEDHTAGNIGPEAGVTYRAIVEAFDGAGASLGIVEDTNVGAVTTYDYDDTTVPPVGTELLRFSVTSVRGAYESWQSPAITTSLTAPVMLIDSLDELETGSILLEDGSTILLE